MTAEGPLVPLRAELIADDQVLVERAGDRLLARPPVAIAGHLEVRGLGIVGVPHVNAVPVEVFLVVDLVQTPASVERLPDPWPHTVLAGVRLPLLTLRPFEASAPLKLLLALISPSLPPLVQ